MREKRKSRIVETWAPNESNIAYARSRGLSEPEIAREAEKFRDHHLKTGTAFVNWDAAWRTWCQRVREFAPRQNGTGPPPKKTAATLVAERLRAENHERDHEALELIADWRPSGAGWS